MPQVQVVRIARQKLQGNGQALPIKVSRILQVCAGIGQHIQ